MQDLCISVRVGWVFNLGPDILLPKAKEVGRLEVSPCPYIADADEEKKEKGRV